MKRFQTWWLAGAVAVLSMAVAVESTDAGHGRGGCGGGWGGGWGGGYGGCGGYSSCGYGGGYYGGGWGGGYGGCGGYSSCGYGGGYSGSGCGGGGYVQSYANPGYVSSTRTVQPVAARPAARVNVTVSAPANPTFPTAFLPQDFGPSASAAPNKVTIAASAWNRWY